MTWPRQTEDALTALYRAQLPSKRGWASVLAGALIGDPTSLLEAMVADGILVRRGEEIERDDGPEFEVAYIVSPEHEHEWKVYRAYSSTAQVELRCYCTATVVVPNKLPIEVPS